MQDAATTTFDEARLNAFVEHMLGDLGAAYTAALVRIGDRLGLYKALQAGPMNSEELAAATGCGERYLREWLAANAASDYLAYDPETGRFTLSPEQAMIFADEDSPVFMGGAFETVHSLYASMPMVEQGFATGQGVGWGDHTSCLFCGVERFFKPGYAAHLIQDWLPALDGVVARLEQGGRVADVGCGHGASTILMGKAFPNAQFVGFDFHPASVEHAREHARAEGVAGNVSFEVASARDYPGSYDLVTVFDALHDMGDPVGAAAHVRDTLNPGGTWMLVEPFARDRLEDNLNPVGRLFYAASTMICVPTSLAQEVGAALGAQAGEARLRQVLAAGGFGECRVAAQTPFNLILEARA